MKEALKKILQVFRDLSGVIDVVKVVGGLFVFAVTWVVIGLSLDDDTSSVTKRDFVPNPIEFYDTCIELYSDRMKPDSFDRIMFLQRNLNRIRGELGKNLLILDGVRGEKTIEAENDFAFEYPSLKGLDATDSTFRKRLAIESNRIASIRAECQLHSAPA